MNKAKERFVKNQKKNNLKGEQWKWLYSDIDDTLLLQDNRIEIPDKKRISMQLLGKTYYLKPHNKNIATIKQLHKQGFTCVAWSAAGQKWAKQAIKQLKLEKYFKYIVSKPVFFIDDKDPLRWIGTNLYKKP